MLCRYFVMAMSGVDQRQKVGNKYFDYMFDCIYHHHIHPFIHSSIHLFIHPFIWPFHSIHTLTNSLHCISVLWYIFFRVFFSSDSFFLIILLFLMLWLLLWYRWLIWGSEFRFLLFTIHFIINVILY